MKINIIVFTSGAGGSSLISGIIARKGYWLGEKTRKLKFDTHENAELVDLNIDLLNASGFNLNDCMELPPPSIGKIRSLIKEVDIRPYMAFIEKSTLRKPWLWKDPRLCYTIHFWKEVFDISACKLIFTTREPEQEYVSMLLNRRVIISFKELLEINSNYERSLDQFLSQVKMSCFKCTFEDLLTKPQLLVTKLSDFLGFDIGMDDVLAVNRGRMGIKKYNGWSFHKARMFYLIFRHLKRDFIKFPRQKWQVNRR